TSLSRARGFLDMMHKGHPEYGCFISKEKILTNFDYDSEVLNVTGPKQKGSVGIRSASNQSIIHRYQLFPGAAI
ncbi:hypothetical protein L208DRAFT_1236101, partial [Tricholoma matsutake]